MSDKDSKTSGSSKSSTSSSKSSSSGKGSDMTKSESASWDREYGGKSSAYDTR